MDSIPEQYLVALVESSQKINSEHQPERLMRMLLDIAVQQLEVDRGFILQDGQISAEYNMNAEKYQNMEDISRSTVDKVLSTLKPLLSFDTQSDERFDASKSIRLHRIRSIACVPIVYSEKLLGILYVDNRNEKARLTRQTLSFLQALANQAAIAMTNISLMSQLQEENAVLKQEFHRIYSFKEIIGKSKTMEQVFQKMGRVLDNTANVLITGESGTGKELVARAIHFNGNRKHAPFVALNCSAIPENLLESELFGHKKGAFTGAVGSKQGLVETANGGTLFLDEVGELPPTIQVKLLRFLQDKTYTPIGGLEPKVVDVRIITATNRDLIKAIKDGQFRQDLYYRLNVIQIEVPPLRERIKDIPLLVKYFMKKLALQMNVTIPRVSGKVIDKLIKHRWPGNVRELENMIERAMVMDVDRIIDIDDVALDDSLPETGIQAGKSLEEISCELLKKTLNAVGGNKTLAAEMMGVSLRWIHYKLKEWGLEN
ncbi:sigma-54-dependent Fis family transcriptional regulator [candidate division KSB1 bacterium]|nr:sigma-54-dependent Fis family transcriptional regulator [candidate division KSB1 bacterium]